MHKIYNTVLVFILFLSCSSNNDTANNSEPPIINGKFANIVSVTASGDENAYTFKVGIKSPDKGCNQYANWWEVISENGDLIYRRILGHSHVNEQPFVRSGGTVNIPKDQIVIIRAHMNTSNYGTQTFKGSVASGFAAFTTTEGFAKELKSQEPQPSGCAF